MPRLRAMNWLRLFPSTAQARLSAPPALDGSCHFISSSWRTTVPSPSIRPWQVDPAHEATAALRRTSLGKEFDPNVPVTRHSRMAAMEALGLNRQQEGR